LRVIVSSSILQNKTKIDVLLIRKRSELVNCPIIHIFEKNLNGQCNAFFNIENKNKKKQGGMPVGRGGYDMQQGHVNPAFIQGQNGGYDGGAMKRFRPDDG